MRKFAIEEAYGILEDTLEEAHLEEACLEDVCLATVQFIQKCIIGRVKCNRNL